MLKMKQTNTLPGKLSRLAARLVVLTGLTAGLIGLGLGSLALAAQPQPIGGTDSRFLLPRLPQIAEIIASTALTSMSGITSGMVGIDPALSPDQSSSLPASSLSAMPPSTSLPDQFTEDLLRNIVHTANANVVVVKSASTSLTPVSTNQATVLNGQLITFTIRITNNGSSPISAISVIDVLPESTLADDIACSGGTACSVIFQTKFIPEPFGSGVLTITIPQVVTGDLAPLNPGQSGQITFKATVACQQEGASFINKAVVSFKENGVDFSNESNELQTTVRVVPTGGGDFSLSDQSTWCSEEPGGTYGLDWGDFDNDGDLDLAIASTAGTVAYRNNNGTLIQFWANDRFTFDVHWVDVDNDGNLELLALSRNGADFSNFSGIIYRLAGNEFVESDTFANGIAGLLRLAPADYDRDGTLELVVLSYLSGSCGLFFFENDGSGNFNPDPDYPACLADSSVRTMAWGDFNNDGYPDLAIGGFSDDQVLLNNFGTLTTAGAIAIDTGVAMFDLVWGDYNADGFLDLAAALGGDQEVRIYQNTGVGFTLVDTKLTSFSGPFLGPFGLDWADFDKDGRLDLAIVDAPPRIFRYDQDSDTFPELFSLTPGTIESDDEVWRIRAVDQDNNGAFDVTIGNRDSQAVLFTAFAPLLKRDLAPTVDPPFALPTAPASSVAWGDVNGDGLLDLLFGAGPPPTAGALGSKLYLNEDGAFPINDLTTFGSFGPNVVAFGDLEGDGDLDFAVGTPGENQVYRNDGATFTLMWQSTGDAKNTKSIAWGDFDGDRDLDLAVGNDGQVNQIYRNNGNGSFGLIWQTAQANNTTSIAWADFDGDLDLDLAVGNRNQPLQLYRNNNGTFQLSWTSILTADTRAIAWGDFDRDGDPDLAVGNYNQPSYIYGNLTKQTPTNPTLTATPVWTLTNPAGQPLANKTTSLAWGDWDSDGDLDLAVGNDGQPDQVFANLSRPGDPNLLLLWSSAESLNTTGVAWGDLDGDGDLDLAISQAGSGKNGVYENLFVSPSHLTNAFRPTMPLPNNPSYLAIERPGLTADGYFYSAPRILSGQVDPVITITFKIFDPDGTRSEATTNAIGDQIFRALYQFSEDGGGTWQTATPAAGYPLPTLVSARLGFPTTFPWDAQNDAALSEDARFRITIIPGYAAGLVQHAPTSAVSPPFRVRGLTCVWPEQAAINVVPPNPTPNVLARFEGSINVGSEVLTFTWDFGDTYTATGQVVTHKYDMHNSYVVTLTVTGQACPIAGTTLVTKTVTVGVGPLNNRIYLPLIQKRSATNTPLQAAGALPEQVAGLSGYTKAEEGSTSLAWRLNNPAENVTEYRIYRSPRGEFNFDLLVSVSGAASTYTDNTAACGYIYYVTAVNAIGESPPSTTSYFSLPCP